MINILDKLKSRRNALQTTQSVIIILPAQLNYIQQYITILKQNTIIDHLSQLREGIQMIS